MIAVHEKPHSAAHTRPRKCVAPKPLTRDFRGDKSENRLINASNSTHQISYSYDYRGRMFEKVTDGVTNSYIWDEFNIVAELSNSQTNYNVWGLDLSGGLQGAGGVGGLLATIQDGQTYFTAYDASGNVTEYVDTNGTVVAHREYGPFGRTIALTGDKKDDFTHWWSTKPWDPTTGLNEYEYRKYSPELGRWSSKDPIGERGGRNLYAFVGNGPADGVDALGLFPKWSIERYRLQQRLMQHMANIWRFWYSCYCDLDEPCEECDAGSCGWQLDDLQSFQRLIGTKAAFRSTTFYVETWHSYAARMIACGQDLIPVPPPNPGDLEPGGKCDPSRHRKIELDETHGPETELPNPLKTEFDTPCDCDHVGTVDYKESIFATWWENGPWETVIDVRY